MVSIIKGAGRGRREVLLKGAGSVVGSALKVDESAELIVDEDIELIVTESAGTRDG